MMAEGLIEDNDLLYFFTHEELETILRTQDPEMAKQAGLRRRALQLQQDLVFPDVFAGKAVPVTTDLSRLPKDKLVKGRTVSRGKVLGVAKVARTVEDAQKTGSR